MPKFYGKIGYALPVENPPGSGIWEDRIEERNYYGDVVRNNRRLENPGQLNDNVRISNSFSIVADEYAYAYFHIIKYIEYNGVKWVVQTVDASQPPRLTLEVGGVYNE